MNYSFSAKQIFLFTSSWIPMHALLRSGRRDNNKLLFYSPPWNGGLFCTAVAVVGDRTWTFQLLQLRWTLQVSWTVHFACLLKIAMWLMYFLKWNLHSSNTSGSALNLNFICKEIETKCEMAFSERQKKSRIVSQNLNVQSQQQCN